MFCQCPILNLLILPLSHRAVHDGGRGCGLDIAGIGLHGVRVSVSVCVCVRVELKVLLFDVGALTFEMICSCGRTTPTL